MSQTVTNLLHQAGVIGKPTCLSITFMLLSVCAMKWFIRRKVNSHYKLPPSPFRLPVIGNLHQLGFLPHRTLALLAKRYGPLMLLHLGNKRTLVVSSACAAQEILKTHDVCFSNRPEMRVLRKLCYNRADVVVAPYGETWRYMRSLLVQQILSPKRVKSFRAIREEETLRMIQKVKEESLGGDPFDLSELLFSLPVRLICKVAFGKNYTEESGSMKFRELLSEFMMLSGSFDVEDFIPWLGWLNNFTGRNGRVNKVFQRIDLLLENILKDHMENSASNATISEEQMDTVDVMLGIQKKSSMESDEGQISLSRDNIKGLILDMFVGGTDTIATTMEWAMTELIRNPAIMKKAKKEIRDIMQTRHHLTEDDITKMDYLKAVIKETYRFHPTAPLLVPRESTQHVNVQGYDIPSETRVMVNVWAIGRDPDSWDTPERFDPERFLRGDRMSARDFKGLSYEFIPFGSGRRGCPGIPYASPVIELALASLVHNFDWSLPGGVKVEGLDVKESFGTTVARKYPLSVVATAATNEE